MGHQRLCSSITAIHSSCMEGLRGTYPLLKLSTQFKEFIGWVLILTWPTSHNDLMIVVEAGFQMTPTNAHM